jgi:hypothetical protein
MLGRASGVEKLAHWQLSERPKQNPAGAGRLPGCGVPWTLYYRIAGSAGQTIIRAVSSYEPARFESRCSEASGPCWSDGCSGLSSERAVPMAAAPAARAAFLATRLTFGRSVFFVVLRLFVLFAFLVFDLVRVRFNEDLAFVRLILFFMLPPSTYVRLIAGPNLNTSGRAELPSSPAVITVFFWPQELTAACRGSSRRSARDSAILRTS